MKLTAVVATKFKVKCFMHCGFLQEELVFRQAEEERKQLEEEKKKQMERAKAEKILRFECYISIQ